LLYYKDLTKKEKLSEAASLLGRKGGKRTMELHGSEHFSKASKARKAFKGGWPKGRPRKERKAEGESDGL
jgi:hypothetical protein